MKTLKKLGLLFMLPLVFFISYSKEDVKAEVEEKSFTDIFIAHAGGAIEDFIYTNSLEALNLSYSKGCKLFELDVIETSDEKLVAAHNWKHYKSITSYSGTVDDAPLTEEQFLSLKIQGKFTPMNMETINEWFAGHKDARLVTDKINSPAEMLRKGFLFKDRLIMELFTWEAVEEAIKEGIKPMPSENLIFETPDIEEKLSDLNIRYIAISRRAIEENKDFLKRIKEKGIKTYVYHVNYDAGKDERYVLENEMDYICGMYADNLDLLLLQK